MRIKHTNLSVRGGNLADPLNEMNPESEYNRFVLPLEVCAANMNKLETADGKPIKSVEIIYSSENLDAS